jgi:AraC family transcriptional regulator
LQRALEIGLEGGSWAEAAHAAAFADAAHLTRTFKRMWGIAPTALGARTSRS